MSITVRSKSIHFDTLGALMAAIFTVVWMFVASTASANAQQSQPVPTTQVTKSVPQVTVYNTTSPVLDTPGKVQLQTGTGTPAKRKHCPKVKSFAKRGHHACVTLAKGTRYTRYAQDRHKTFHKIAIKAPAKFKVFKWHGKWYLISDGSRFNVGTAEFQPAQYILVKTFQPAAYTFTVDYSVTNDISIRIVCKAGPKDVPGTGTASSPDKISVTVNAVFDVDAAGMIIQNVPQPIKDSVSALATKDAYDKLNKGDSLACPEQMSPPVDLFDPTAVNITTPDYITVTAGSQTAIYVQVKKNTAPGVTFDFDPFSWGELSAKQPSTTIDNKACPPTDDCFMVVYTAPKEAGFDLVSASQWNNDGQQLGGDAVFIEITDDDFGS